MIPGAANARLSHLLAIPIFSVPCLAPPLLATPTTSLYAGLIFNISCRRPMITYERRSKSTYLPILARLWLVSHPSQTLSMAMLLTYEQRAAKVKGAMDSGKLWRGAEEKKRMHVESRATRCNDADGFCLERWGIDTCRVPS